jgi:shikimate dehydrogenase
MRTQPIDITGRTAIVGLIGDPIEHVQSPSALLRHFTREGIDAVSVPVHVTAESLPTAVAMFRAWQNLVGFGVTMPHKGSVMPHLDEVSEMARLTGACNIVRRVSGERLVGGQLDGAGFADALEATGFDPRGARVLMVGAGGVARGIAFELAARGADRITIANRTVARAEQLADRVTAAFPRCKAGTGEAKVDDHDLVINATSLGTHDDDPLPLDVDTIPQQAVVAEVVGRGVTPLLATAAARGCRTVPGRAMLDAQVAATVDFLGLAPG